MRTKLWAIMLMAVCTLFTSSAQLLYKAGADKIDFSKILQFNFGSVLSNWYIFLGMFFYLIGAVLLIAALKGGEVTVLYPIVASSYIWVALGSGYFFGEIMNSFRWIGIMCVIGGISLINFGGKWKEGIEV